jgi:hypothetical protein
VVLRHHHGGLLGLRRAGEGREAAKVAEQRRDLSAVERERVGALRHDRVGDMLRYVPAQLTETLHLGDLRVDPLLKRAVERREFLCLDLDVVLVLADLHERPDPREELRLIERLGEEVVGAAIESPDTLLPDRRRHHHDGQRLRCAVGPEATAHLETIDVRQLHIEEDELWALASDGFQRFVARRRDDDAIVARDEHLLEQSDVGGCVVHDEDRDDRKRYAGRRRSGRRGEVAGDL